MYEISQSTYAYFSPIHCDRQFSDIIESMHTSEKSIIWYISIIGFLGIFSTTISKNPVLPLFIQGLGGADWILGIIASASPLAGIILSFPVGYIADEIGKRKLLIVSAIVFTVAPLLYLFVTNPLLLIPIRLFHGTATAIMVPVASALIVGYFDKNKAERLGIYSSATLFGRTLAPLAGGFIISYFASMGNLINFRIVYMTAFVASLPILILTLLIPKEPGTHVAKVSMKNMLSALRQFFREKVLIATAGVDMSTYFIYGVLEAYLPVFLISKHIPANLIGLLFSLQVISIAITKPFFGKLADRIDKRVQILVGISILMVTTVSIYYISNFVLLMATVLIFGIGMSLSTIATNTYMVELVEKGREGSALGLLSSLMDVGQTSGPFLTGFIVTWLSYQAGFFFAGFVALLSALYFFYHAVILAKRNRYH